MFIFHDDSICRCTRMFIYYVSKEVYNITLLPLGGNTAHNSSNMIPKLSVPRRLMKLHKANTGPRLFRDGYVDQMTLKTNLNIWHMV